jgi:hypothetical protein
MDQSHLLILKKRFQSHLLLLLEVAAQGAGNETELRLGQTTSCGRGRDGAAAGVAARTKRRELRPGARLVST